MKAYKRLVSLAQVAIYMLFLAAPLGLAPAAYATVSTKTWSGAGSNEDFSTAANWVGGVAPSAGDNLVFPVSASSPILYVNNDYASGTVFGSITYNGSVAGSGVHYVYQIGGNPFVLSGGLANNVANGNGDATVDVQNQLSINTPQAFSAIDGDYITLDGALGLGSNNLTISGAGDETINGLISGSGSIIKNSTGRLTLTGNNVGYTGAIVANAGSLVASAVNSSSPSGINYTLGAAGGGGVTINDGADLALTSCDVLSMVVPQSITLTGDSSSTGPTPYLPIPKLSTGLGVGCSTGGSSPVEIYGFGTNGTTVMSGHITLGSDITFGSYSKTTTLTGTLTGAHSFNLLPGWTGRLVVNSSSNGTSNPNGNYTPATYYKTLTDSQPTHTVQVGPGAVITIDGTRSNVLVQGGYLKGTGHVGQLQLNTGDISPGDSPGVLNVSSISFTTGTLDEELGGTGAGQFDQLNSTGAVNLGIDTTLSVSLVNGFKPAKGNTFTIINNQTTGAVTGAFKNLPEGATFNVGDYVFQITYRGGDGNDVVLTALNVPSTPSTGWHMLTSNPLLLVVLIGLLAAGLALTGRTLRRRLTDLV